VRSIAILGPGAVGGFVAAVLTRAGEDVVVVGRGEEVELIAQRGISVQSKQLGELTARPQAVAELAGTPDYLIVATKATTLAPALERIRALPGLVVPLLNGIEHMATLRDRFGTSRVAAGVIRMEADCPEPGRVVHSSPSVRVDLTTDDPALRDRLEVLASALEHAGIPVKPGEREVHVLWSKLVRLAPLACTTSVADQPIGFIRSDPRWRPILLSVIGEVVAVANAEGAQIDPAVPLAELEDAHPTLGSSMQRDLAAGREPELDAIGGAVLRGAARHAIPCPELTALVTMIAARAGLPAPAPAPAPVGH
jgi:2-dehydropantoate 2-reductase